MADGNPKFGGYNGVAVLDVGQPGGTRHGAGQALWSGQVLLGEDRARTVSAVPMQGTRVWRTHLGFEGGTHWWTGHVFAASWAYLQAIVDSLNSYAVGAYRDGSTGNLLSVNPSRLWATRLTDHDGKVLTSRAVLAGWRGRGRRVHGQTWNAIMPVEIRFEVLG